MNRYVLLTILSLAAVVGCALCADDAQAAGHRRSGCGASAGCSGHYAGWYPGKVILGFERRQDRRERRHARWAADYGCAGAPASCAGHDAEPEPSEPVSVAAPCPLCPDCPAGVCPKT